MKDSSRLLSIALEAVGISSIIAGICVESVTHAELGLVVITSGSVLIAAGGLLWSKIIKGGK